MDVISLILGVIGGFSFYHWVWIRLIKWFDKKRFFRFFRIKGAEDRILIIVPTQKMANVSHNIITTHEDAMAQVELQCEFIKYGVKHDISLDKDVADEILRSRHIILIGGPAANDVTKRLYEKSGQVIPVKFQRKDDKWVIIKDGGRTYDRSQLGENYDYGILTRINNPWSSSPNLKLIILGAGIQALGTWGVIHIISQNTRYLWKKLCLEDVDKNNPHFWTIIEAERNDTKSPSTSILDNKAI
jgi:hypothetical protein